MPWQSELFTAKALTLVPADGVEQPRLWVRRLVIWDAPGGEVIRDIGLRPGLNIIWSPDPSEHDADGTEAEPAALGHGSGKTLLSRLLRYCLGEERFASGDLLSGIRHRFKDGIVGAEVILRGEVWLVIRPLGIGNRNIAMLADEGDTLGALATNDMASTGMTPLLDAIVAHVISPSIAALVPMRTNKSPWLVALAWLARDQECRFGRVLDWRHPQSQTGSPAQGMSATNALDAVRAFADAIDPEEPKRRQAAERLKAKQKKAETERGHQSWQIRRLRGRLGAATGLALKDIELGTLGVDILRQKVADLQKAAMQSGADEPRGIRVAHTDALIRQAELKLRYSLVEDALSELLLRLERLKGEVAGAEFTKNEAEVPICPVCVVPIDRVLAAGCGLSHKLPDLESARRRHTRLLTDLRAQTAEQAELMRRRTELVASIEAAERDVTALAERLNQAEVAAKVREDAWYTVRRAAEDVEHLQAAYAEQRDRDSEIGQLKQEAAELLDQAKALRAKHDAVYRQWQRLFDGVVREIVPEARGKVQVDGNGLTLTINMGGDRSTAAIESIKVLAFDLAVLCMSIEGKTHLPAFLIHDSPREADLGLSVYHALFRFVKSLETLSDAPLFQYVITTTTRPPPELCEAPWLAQTLGGAPASARLLRRDL